MPRKPLQGGGTGDGALDGGRVFARLRDGTRAATARPTAWLWSQQREKELTKDGVGYAGRTGCDGAVLMICRPPPAGGDIR